MRLVPVRVLNYNSFIPSFSIQFNRSRECITLNTAPSLMVSMVVNFYPPFDNSWSRLCRCKFRISSDIGYEFSHSLFIKLNASESLSIY